MRVSFMMMAMLLCGMVFGYELGISPIVIPAIRSVFYLSFNDVSLITALLPITIACSAVMTGLCSDRFGRRTVMLLGAFLVVIGTLECSIAESIAEFVFGRIVLGVGMGLSAVMLPLYLVEVAPAVKRGQWVALYFLCVNIGLFFSCIIGCVVTSLEAWRTEFVMAFIPAILFYAFGFFLPESPRWLILQGKQGQASQAAIKLFGARQAMAMISAMSTIEHRHLYSPITLNSHQGLRILLLGSLMNIFAQAVGIHAVVVVAITMLQKMNLKNTYVDLFSNSMIPIVLVFAALLSTRIIDSFSRRKVLLLGMSGMVTSLVMMLWAQHNMAHDDFMIIVLLFGCIFFVGSQGFSIGPISSLLPAEIFPQALRGFGLGLSIAAYWMTNMIIVYAFPRLLDGYGAIVSFLIFLLFTVIAWVWIYYNIPETSQISLECLEKNVHEGLHNRELGLPLDVPQWEPG